MTKEIPDGFNPNEIPSRMEDWQSEGERRKFMPWEGERFVSEVEKHKGIQRAKEISFPRIEEDIMDGLAYQMGRLVERTGYYLEPEGLGASEIYDLIGIFCTVEEGRKRPKTQITTAIENATLTNIHRINKGEIDGWEDEEVDLFSLFGVDKEDQDEVEKFHETKEYQLYKKERDRWLRANGQEELSSEAKADILKKITKLKFREVHRKFLARESISKADLQRLLTADNADSTVDMILRGKDPWWQDVETPDALVWASAFEGEFGQGVDEVLREIVRLGEEGFTYDKKVGTEVTPKKLEKPYAELAEFSEEHAFTEWIRRLYEKSGERMDIVLFAWQLARVWGITDELGYTTEEEVRKVYGHSSEKDLGEKKVKLHKIGDSPLVTDHSTWTMHTVKKLASEYGLTAFDQRKTDPELAKKYPFLTCYRTTQDRHISHSGAPYHYHPETLASLYKPYLKWAKVPISKSRLTEAYRKEKGIVIEEGDGKEMEDVPLYDLWIGKAVEEKQSLSELPWSSTAMTELQADEPLPKASFGLWQIQKNRTLTVVNKAMRGVPSLKDLISVDWWEGSHLRHLKKVARVDQDGPIEENPRVRLLMDWLLVRRPTYNIKGGLLDYHYKDSGETWVGKIADKSARSIDLILNNALNVGFINKEEWQKIKDELSGTMVITQNKDPEFYRNM